MALQASTDAFQTTTNHNNACINLPEASYAEVRKADIVGLEAVFLFVEKVRGPTYPTRRYGYPVPDPAIWLPTYLPDPAIWLPSTRPGDMATQ